eukprot:g848.t1
MEVKLSETVSFRLVLNSFPEREVLLTDQPATLSLEQLQALAQERLGLKTRQATTARYVQVDFGQDAVALREGQRVQLRSDGTSALLCLLPLPLRKRVQDGEEPDKFAGLSTANVLRKLHSKNKAKRELAMEYVEVHTEAIIKHSSFLKLPKSTLKAILSSDQLACSEVEIVQAVKRWADAVLRSQEEKKESEAGATGRPELKDMLQDVVPLLRLPSLSTGDFASVASLGLLEPQVTLDLFQYIAMREDAEKQETKRQLEPSHAVAVSCHPHRLQLCSRNTGWTCDGSQNAGGCLSRGGPHRLRYRCTGSCDYDLCDPCFQANRADLTSEKLPDLPKLPASLRKFNRNARKTAKSRRMLFLADFGSAEATAGVGRAFFSSRYGRHFQLAGCSQALVRVSKGALQITEGTGKTVQALLKEEIALPAGYKGSVHVLCELTSEGRPGSWHIGLQVGPNQVVFHPGYSGGACRVNGPQGFDNRSMGFTPVMGTFHTLMVTLTTSPTVNLSIAKTDDGTSKFSASFTAAKSVLEKRSGRLYIPALSLGLVAGDLVSGGCVASFRRLIVCTDEQLKNFQ